MSLEEFLLRAVVAAAEHTTSMQLRESDGFKRAKLGPAGIFTYSARFNSWRAGTAEHVRKRFDNE